MYKINKIINNNVLLSTLRNVHINLYSVLYKTILLLDKYKINYSIFGGNVLGYLRNKEIILWDDDIDLVILDTDLHKLYNKEFINDCYENNLNIIKEIINGQPDIYHIFNNKEKVFNDIIIMNQKQYQSSNNPFGKKILGSSKQLDIFIYTRNNITNMCDYLYNSPWQNRFINYNDFVNSTIVSFGPLKVKLIRNPHNYLSTFIKGDYINKEFVITHLHNNLLKYIFKNLPYRLTNDEINIVKKFTFNINLNELVL
jgi:phosphorylcholine metabolism protein LicD